MSIFKKLFMKVVHAVDGILSALLHDTSYQIQVFGGAIVLAIFIFLFAPLSKTDILFLGLSWALLLITELQNSSIEEALDKLHPELHESIRKSKDKAAGAVLTAGFFLIFVMLVIAFF